MPVRFIPFGEWLPDRGYIANPGMLHVKNALPYSGSYVPVGQITSLAATSRAIRGLYVHPKGPSASSYMIYVGEEGYLQEVDPLGGYLVTDRSKAGVAPVYSNNASHYNTCGWRFTSFGEHVCATNLIDPPQIQLNAAGAFQDMITSGVTGLKARYITTVRNHVLLGFYNDAGTDYPQGVWWSQSDNARAFSTPALSSSIGATSDNQVLNDDYGHITGIVGGDYAVIFRERAIQRMDGPPWSFETIVRGVGTRYPNSICSLGSDIYFWAQDGPRVLRNGTSVESLGAGRFRRAMVDRYYNFATLTGTTIGIDGEQFPYQVSAAADPSSMTVWWVYRSGGTSVNALAVNVAEDGAAGMISQPYQMYHLCTKADTGEEWGLGRDIIFGAKDASNQWFVGRFNRGNTAANPGLHFITGMIRLGANEKNLPVRASVDWVRPIYSGQIQADMAVQVYAARYPVDGLVSLETSTADGDGRFGVRRLAAAEHMFGVTVSAGLGPYDIYDIKGVEVGYSLEGSK